MGDNATETVDPRHTWMIERLKVTFNAVKGDKILKGFNTEENLVVVQDFLDNSDTRACIVSTDNIIITPKFPKKLPKTGKASLFLKLKSVGITDKNIAQEVIVMELTSDPLAHLELVLHEIYLPLLNNPKNQKGWGEVASKEIIDLMHNFLSEVTITVGQLKGETCLPLPPSFDNSGGANNKERIHLLETAVITWTKQIRSVLNLDPENMMKKGLNPTPDVEIEFWKSKASNLNSIYAQLQGDKIRKVLKFLESNKSTYCNAFGKICKEIISAREEANDNVKYLMTLEQWFDRLNNSLSFPGLVELFKPMMHIILLVWKNSQHYNTPARLVVLIREICNSLINQACKYVSGEEIFRLIEADEARKAVEQLKTTLKVCGTFKSTYFDYKATANSECPTNQWRIQNNALFMRLDSFLERCHDILDLTQTIVQFSRLAKIDIGGTKGKTLSTSVVQIYSDFLSTVDKFKNVPYDIMDVGAKQFDDDFYEFRCSIKELERRLGSVITQAFDDSNTIYGRFKLLDSFEGLLERPIIQDELEKKHVVLVQSYGKDLKAVQELFLKDKDDPPIGSNLPPIAGSLTWCKGLTERIEEPMEKLKQLNRSI
jgi:dynein heavy chain